jgi:lipopolysaccharide transport system ATP-binding protein
LSTKFCLLVTSGKTTVFISHNLHAVEQLCDRLIWLDNGRIRSMGEPGRVLEEYLTFLEDAATAEPSEDGLFSETNRTGNKLRISSVQLRDRAGTPKQIFMSGEDLAVDITFETDRPIRAPHFCIWVSDSLAPNPLFAANMMLDGEAPPVIEGRGVLRCIFKQLPLMPRAYYVWVEVWGADRAEILFRWQRLGSLRVIDHGLLQSLEGQPTAVGFAKAHAPLRVPYEWHMLGESRPNTTASVVAAKGTTRHD